MRSESLGQSHARLLDTALGTCQISLRRLLRAAFTGTTCALRLLMRVSNCFGLEPLVKNSKGNESYLSQVQKGAQTLDRFSLRTPHDDVLSMENYVR